MPRLALANMAFGFLLLFLAAAAGAFIATDLTNGFLKDRAFLDSWAMMLNKSAHGHSNLFALMHITFGLTMPYSVWNHRVKLVQTAGLLLGSVAMGPGMMLRAQLGAKDGTDLLALTMGVMLSATLAALLVHAAGIGAKAYWRA